MGVVWPVLFGTRVIFQFIAVVVLALGLLLAQFSPVSAQSVNVPEVMPVLTNPMVCERRSGNTLATLTVTNTGGEAQEASVTPVISDLAPPAGQVGGYAQDSGPWSIALSSDQAAGAATLVEVTDNSPLASTSCVVMKVGALLRDGAYHVVANMPEITVIHIEPRYFNPVFNAYSSVGAGTANATVRINKSATLVRDILNSEGQSVQRITASNCAWGKNAVTCDGGESESRVVAYGTCSIRVVAVDASGTHLLPRYATTAVRS